MQENKLYTMVAPEGGVGLGLETGSRREGTESRTSSEGQQGKELGQDSSASGIAQLLTSCVTLGKSPHLSEPQFPLLQIAAIYPHPTLLLRGSNKMTQVSCSVHSGQCLVIPVNTHSTDHVPGTALST